jgi:hypothetical protein
MVGVSKFLAALGRAARGALDALWRSLSSDPEDRPWERAAVRIVVPFAFVSAALVAVFVAYRTDRPPGVAFENHLLFGGELLVLTFYGVLLVLVPLVRAIAGGELPVELNARGARFAERGNEEALAVNRDLFDRFQSIEGRLRDLDARGERNGRQAARSATDLEGDLASLRARLDEIEGTAK